MGPVQTRSFHRVVEPGNLEQTVNELTAEANTFLLTLLPTNVLKVDEQIVAVRDRVFVGVVVVFLEE